LSPIKKQQVEFLMTIYPILIAPDPRLKFKSELVRVVDDDIRQLMGDMLETMHSARGIGLAAPQIDVQKRIIVVDAAHEGEDPQPLRMVNPEIIEVSDEDLPHDEGCLSFPEHFSEVIRPTSVRVRYLDYANEIRELDADGILAVCIQHEIDHLDGILFVDHISALKRNMILRKLTKLKKQEATA
jgi:peptide deformylase